MDREQVDSDIALMLRPTAVFAPLSIGLFAFAMIDGAPLDLALFAFAISLAAWTIGEYVLHRWVQHNPRLQLKYGHNHMLHHNDPHPAIHFVYSLSMTLPMVPLAFAAYWAMYRRLDLAAASASATCASYLANEWVHYCAHRPQLRKRFKLVAFITKHHLRHHGNADVCFGFFTSLWDRIFRTMPGKRASAVTADTGS